jgi:glycosidase
MSAAQKPVIYQLVVRYFGNTILNNKRDGNIAENGCGKFNDINAEALKSLRDLGVTHLWLTGCLRQATLTDYSAIGLPADDPDVVKGIAGSFYAVRDYYDVCPDYAADPSVRTQEFEALVQRAHTAGLQVIIDFVSNHVSRSYYSAIKPQESLGRGDDTTQFFSMQNHFFYLVTPANQVLHLSKPSSWNPPGFVFDGRFAPEDGSPGYPPKATGNNSTSPNPSSTDWYDSVKLNYGFNFITQQGFYLPHPHTWASVDAILAYWQAKGVDGFRCDFAHYAPAEAWAFLIAQARERRSAYFFAEAYPFIGSGDPVQSQGELIQAGFDAVYHYQSYNALKGIYTDGRIDDYDREMVTVSDSLRSHLVDYIENHDERRVASAIVSGSDPGASGFGSAEAGRLLAPLQFLYGSGPVMLLNGQEVGEPGVGAEGFGGEDGRTTIYDYWTMPEFAKWVNGHRYDGAGLSPSQKALRNFYGALLRLCQHPSVIGDGYWGLRYFNRPERFADCPADLYSFARFRRDSGEALLIAANLSFGNSITGQIRLPKELSALVSFRPTVAVELILDSGGAANLAIASLTVDQLQATGFAVSIPNQTSHVYWLGSRSQ